MSDYGQGLEQTGIYPQHPLAEDGWTIAAGAQERSVRIDHDNFEDGPLVRMRRPGGQ